MSKVYRTTWLRVCLAGVAMLATLPGMVCAQSAPPVPTEGGATAKVDVKSLVIADLKETREKIVGLAQAMPEDKYAWTPRPGVRSVGEVYIHIARANFTFPTAWGVPPPPAKELGRMPYPKKERVVQLLDMSFDFLQNYIAGIPDSQLSQPRDFHGRQMTLAAILFHIAGHEHEHLGQSIAYARMNGVVPPWSQAETPTPAAQKPKR